MLDAKNYPINCGTANSIFARQFSKKTITERSFDIEAVEHRRIIASGSISNISINDRSILRNISTSYVSDFIVKPIIRIPKYENNIIISSENPSVLSQPSGYNIESKILTYQSDGTCVIKATSDNGEIALIKLSSSSSPSATVDTFLGWLNNSLASHCEQQLDSRLSGSMEIYSTQDITNGNSFIRNQNCWVNNIDLTCISPWNSTGRNTMGGTLISRKHVLFCEHLNFRPEIGATIKFVTSDNVIISRTIANRLTHPSYVPYYPDICIALLDSDVPESISFAKVLPSNWKSYLPSLSTSSAIPVLRLNQYERASVADWRGSLEFGKFSLQYPSSTLRQTYYENIIIGDSGNPVFIIIDGNLVVLGTFTSGVAGGGTLISDHIDAINIMMNTLGGGQLTTINLSSFPTY
jgi:hypothetical protein